MWGQIKNIQIIFLYSAFGVLSTDYSSLLTHPSTYYTLFKVSKAISFSQLVIHLLLLSDLLLLYQFFRFSCFFSLHPWYWKTHSLYDSFSWWSSNWKILSAFFPLVSWLCWFQLTMNNFVFYKKHKLFLWNICFRFLREYCWEIFLFRE